jgi:hypothetical protein
MEMRLMKKILILLVIPFLFFTLITCGSSRGGIRSASVKGTVGTPGSQVKKGPPAHAPAHGYRAKFHYRYYPSFSVYFDINRNLYFYLAGNDWRVASTLPAQINIKSSRYVIIKMDTDKPYLDHKKHKQKYPPGWAKKNK